MPLRQLFIRMEVRFAVVIFCPPSPIGDSKVDPGRKAGFQDVFRVQLHSQRVSVTAYRMAQRHQIPSFLFGGSRCFDPSELALWLIKKEPQLAAAAHHFQKCRLVRAPR